MDELGHVSVKTECYCGRATLFYGGKSTNEDGSPHECSPNYVTDYWKVTKRNGDLLTVVYGKSYEAATSRANQSKAVREYRNRAGGFTMRRMTSAQLMTYQATEIPEA